MDQLIDHPFLVEGEAARNFAFPQNALNLADGRGLAYGLAASTGISRDYWHLIFDTIACGVVLINTDMQIVEANRAAEQILGIRLASMQQYLFASDGAVFRRPDGTPLPYEELQVATIFRTGQAQSRVLEGFVRPDGQLRWLEIDAAPVCEKDGTITHAAITFVDVTERVKMEEALRYQTRYDGLTDLPNSTHFIEILEQEALTAQGEQRSMAVLVLDIDRFKDVNDTFGHQHGDLLLQQVAIRLREIVPAPDLISRLSGDEFAILLLDADKARAAEVAAAIRCALEEPCIVDGYPVQIDISIGASLYPDHADDAITLLRRADMTMYTVKQVHDGYGLFQCAFEQYNPQRLTLISELRRAIAANELRLYYQPKLALASGTVGSVEALVRWQHPSRGMIPPDQFIPLAEQTGLIGPLSTWVLEEAARQCREWLRAGYRLSIAINLSAWNLRDATLPKTIADLLVRYAIPPNLLCIELTESAVMTDARRSLDVLAQIFALGVHISIDDFGTGYSSLAYLKQLPIDELKIDRSFVQQMTTNKADATIVRSTINLAHSFGLRVVAEGVEDVPTLELLSTLHCDLAQGYYMSRPLPVEQLERWLKETMLSKAIA